MKLRLPGRRADTSTPDTTVVTPHGSTAVGAGKGRPTPKRNEAQGRRTGPVPPPPTTRKEAYRRQREQQLAGRGSAREAAARGDDSALTPRDRGPERRLVRDIVDARRNLGSFFLVIAALLLVSLVVPSQSLQVYSSLLLYAFFLVLIVDSIVLGRKIKAKVTERFPNTTQKHRSLMFYGISRATMVRRWRYPKPQVALGAEV
ncbi:DUF3043 domain-containing protein [Modestobacter sp. VKM Ac-2986]|uniref:DUF3043 domain-containing protein n=1 Tax=Modestobacter sp. VKM Ac-2986 TaxID=3004140 RepID=UPI0022AA77CB|nr:DUF3043 domain-containing protein [Modestobacter sp. VKM Ac-2986]MCZ2828375.1 DUF3043 domain-containing protein [Modestobacter sp. VKM Ac-2986]